MQPGCHVNGAHRSGRSYETGLLNEGWSGPNKYTFEVYQLENGRYRALARKWNGKINKVQQETQYLSDTREGLKHQDYPRTRQVKIFLNSPIDKDFLLSS